MASLGDAVCQALARQGVGGVDSTVREVYGFVRVDFAVPCPVDTLPGYRLEVSLRLGQFKDGQFVPNFGLNLIVDWFWQSKHWTQRVNLLDQGPGPWPARPRAWFIATVVEAVLKALADESRDHRFGSMPTARSPVAPTGDPEWAAVCAGFDAVRLRRLSMPTQPDGTFAFQGLLGGELAVTRGFSPSRQAPTKAVPHLSLHYHVVLGGRARGPDALQTIRQRAAQLMQALDDFNEAVNGLPR